MAPRAGRVKCQLAQASQRNFGGAGNFTVCSVRCGGLCTTGQSGYRPCGFPPADRFSGWLCTKPPDALMPLLGRPRSVHRGLSSTPSATLAATLAKKVDAASKGSCFMTRDGGQLIRLGDRALNCVTLASGWPAETAIAVRQSAEIGDPHISLWRHGHDRRPARAVLPSGRLWRDTGAGQQCGFATVYIECRLLLGMQ